MKIIDQHFSHCVSAGNPYFDNVMPFIWERNFNVVKKNEPIIVTDSCYQIGKDFNYPNLFLWVLESPAVIPNSTKKDIINNHNKFVKILTHDDDLMKLGNAVHFPIGGCWIKKNDCQIYHKNKKVSLILSHKNFYPGQKLRHEIACEKLTENFGFNGSNLNYKLDALRSFKFHVCIENMQNNYYFSEKLIDCLATGTIPIYWGCTKLDSFFNTEGIIEVKNFNDLKFTLRNLDSIHIKDEIIQENFNLSKKFWLPEDRLNDLFSS